jgi:DDE superfamily endonuclease
MKELTGLDLGQMDWLYTTCRDPLLSLRLSMHQKDLNIPIISPHNMLCITLYWLRTYTPYDRMAALFHRKAPSLWYLVTKVVDILDSTIVPALICPVNDSSPSSTLSTLPFVKVIVDTTFVPLPKTPFDPKLYHKKSPTKAAWKFEVGCDLSHRIVSVSKAYRGPTDDRRILRESGLLNQTSDTARIIADRGYQGNLGVITPARRKGKRNRELAQLEDERTKRHELETERAAIENINKRLKDWEIIRGRYRGGYDNTEYIDPIIRVVCALAELIMQTHPLRKAK